MLNLVGIINLPCLICFVVVGWHRHVCVFTMSCNGNTHNRYCTEHSHKLCVYLLCCRVASFAQPYHLLDCEEPSHYAHDCPSSLCAATFVVLLLLLIWEQTSPQLQLVLVNENVCNDVEFLPAVCCRTRNNCTYFFSS